MEFGSHKESGQPNLFKEEQRSVAPSQSTGEVLILCEASEPKKAEILQPPKKELTCREEYEAQIICRANKQQHITALRRSKEFEELISRDPLNKSAYLEYAKWQEEYTKWPKGFNIHFARSTWKRAVSVYRQDPNMWKEYAHFEMRNGCMDDARTVWFNAVRSLPQVDELWKEQIHMEEMLGNFKDVRYLFEEWMRQQPSKQGWLSYIEYELKYNGVKSARGIFERFVEWSPQSCYAWIEYAALERSSGEIQRARSIFERAFDQPTLDMPDLLWKAYFEFAKSSLGEVGDIDQLLKKQKS